jgi:hypothetical protein
MASTNRQRRSKDAMKVRAEDSQTHTDGEEEDTNPHDHLLPQKQVQLRGILKMLFSRQQQDCRCSVFQYDPTKLEEVDIMLRTKRRNRRLLPQGGDGEHNNSYYESSTPLFLDLVGSHRYVAFFVIQGNRSGFYSTHTVNMRKRLATGYHDSMTTFCIFIGSSPSSSSAASRSISSSSNGGEIKGTKGNNDNTDTAFLQGTGFATLEDSTPPLLLTLLNITQLPSVVVIDTATGRKVSEDAGLAIDWNDAHLVLNAWQRGKSGLTCSQTTLAVLTCQGSAPCVIQ